MGSIAHTLEQFRENPALHYLTPQPVWVGVDTNCGERTGRPREYAEVVVMNSHGCVVLGNYMWPAEWSLGERAVSPQGDGLYVVPWEELSGPYTERQVEQILACQAVDHAMLANAR